MTSSELITQWTSIAWKADCLARLWSGSDSGLESIVWLKQFRLTWMLGAETQYWLLTAFAAPNAAGIERVKTELSLADIFFDVRMTTKLAGRRLKACQRAEDIPGDSAFFTASSTLHEEKISFDLYILALKSA